MDKNLIDDVRQRAKERSLARIKSYLERHPVPMGQDVQSPKDSLAQYDMMGPAEHDAIIAKQGPEAYLAMLTAMERLRRKNATQNP